MYDKAIKGLTWLLKLWADFNYSFHDVIFDSHNSMNKYGSHQRKQASVWSCDTNNEQCQARMKTRLGI